MYWAHLLEGLEIVFPPQFPRGPWRLAAHLCLCPKSKALPMIAKQVFQSVPHSMGRRFGRRSNQQARYQ